ncbi:MAG: DNA translocase FtsK [Muribaculaceae bacterium]|nr:DNA translocase FtsK [Muribaculaceae bacterium]
MSSYNPNEYDPSVVDSDDIYTHPERMGGRGRSPEPVQDLDSYLRSDTPRVHRNPDSQQDTKRTVPRQKVKKPKTEDDGPGFFKSIANFVTDRRTHGAIGIGLILFSAYVLIASLSYFVTGRHDQSAITSHSIEQLAANGGTENIGGPTGAVLSQVVLTNSLGLGAGVIIFYMTIIGLALLRVRKINFWSLTFKCLLIAITISLVAGLLTYPLENSFLYGGQHGRWINTLLIQRTGWIGAVFVSIFLVGCIVFIYLNELITLYMAYRRRVAEHKAKVEAARKAREEADAKVRENSTNDILNQDIEDVVIISHPEDPVVGFENANEEDHTDSQDPFEAEKPEIIDPDITERQPIRPYAGGKTLNDVYATTDPVPVQTQQTVEQGQDQPGESAAPQQFNTEEKLAEIPVVDTGKQSDENTVPQVEYQPQSEEPVFIENVTQEIETADSINRKPFDPTSELPEFKLPPIDILREYEDTRDNLEVDQESNEQKDEIIHALDTYGIKISKVEATVGATITLFEITPVEGTRVQTIKRLGDDLMMTLAAKGIRIIAPIPGKSSIGIEVPNKNPQVVSIRSILSSKDFQESKYELPIAMGTTISNKVYITDLAKMPHLLVAGATGQGKSVGLNTIIASLLYKKHPATLKFVLVDPKMVEFSLYNCLERHYLAKLPDEESPVITESDKVVNTLNSLCVEMDNRYRLLMSAGCRNIVEYNNKFINREIDEADGHRFLPYIVIIVDEYGDLLMTAGKDIETPIARIGQKARAVGMHMILATQRPSTKIVNGTIKANFPGRIAFKVASGVDSQTILDRPGANQLIGRGDMLIWANGSIERVQCAFIDTPEVESVCRFISRQPSFLNAYPLPEYIPEGAGGNGGNAGALTDRDPLFDEIARYISMSNQASTTSLQRRYSIGFARAGKIMDQLEAAGIVGPSLGGKPRNVLMSSMEVEQFLEQR